MYFSKKCPQCGLLNYSDSPITACTACRAPLHTVNAEGAPATPLLEPCEDCKIPISPRAQSCPHCGRFYRSLTERPERDRTWWVITIMMAVWIVAMVVYITAAAVAYLFAK